MPSGKLCKIKASIFKIPSLYKSLACSVLSINLCKYLIRSIPIIKAIKEKIIPFPIP